MNLAGDVFAFMRSLIEEEDNDELTDDLLVPHVNMAQEALIAQVLSNPNIERMKSIVVVPNIAAGTTDLSAQFDPTKPLALLRSVISMRERQTGQDDSAFLPMLPSIDMPSLVQSTFNAYYQYNGSTIKLPGASQALDFRVYGAFDPKDIVDATSPIIPGTRLILANYAAATLCRPRNTQLAADLKLDAVMLGKKFMNMLIMEIQDERVRQAPFRRC